MSITIQGFEFEVPAPYVAGHVLSAGEASALNQVLAENLRNNFASKVKAAKEEAEKAGTEPDIHALQDALTAYASEYEFGVRSAGSPRATVDPVTREALNLAREAIRAAAKAKGLKLDKEKVEELATGLIEKDPKFRATAEERVAQKKAIAAETLESIGL